MNAFNWINDLAQWLAKIFPRLTLVRPTHAAVIFGPRGGASNRGCGLKLWLPICQELVEVPVAMQTMELAARSLETAPEFRDRYWVPTTAVVGLHARYRVVDPVKAAKSTIALRGMVDNTCQASFVRAWSGGLDQMNQALRRAFAESSSVLLDRYGCELCSLEITQCAYSVSIKNFDDWSQANGDD